jgi:hypothetical protein
MSQSHRNPYEVFTAVQRARKRVLGVFFKEETRTHVSRI